VILSDRTDSRARKVAGDKEGQLYMYENRTMKPAEIILSDGEGERGVWI
jgi:hypothetical protein